jgi:hypothetical protein
MTAEDWTKLLDLKRDAMASFAMIGIMANPGLTYLTPAQVAEKAIKQADTLQTMLDTEVTPQKT